MSYDLYFRHPSPPSQDSLREYFSKRKHFAVDAKRVHYENERTGVYFGFDFIEAGGDEVPAAFNLNYFRPHVFGLEAEPELTRFIKTFELGVHDPQADGMGDGPYTAEGFLKGWNHGNAFGYRACLTMPETKAQVHPMLPAERHRAIWRFNRSDNDIMECLLAMIDELPPAFAPTAMLLSTPKDKVVAGVVWSLDMPIVLPDVDLVLSKREGEALRAAPLRELLPMVKAVTEWAKDFEPDGNGELGLKSWVVDEPSAALSDRLWEAMKPVELARLPTDQVLDAELVAQVR